MQRRRDKKPWMLVLVTSGIAVVALAILVANMARGVRIREPVALVVRCVDASGKPLAGVDVAFHNGRQPLGDALLRTRTTADGTATIPKEIARGGWFCIGHSESLGSRSQCYIEEGDAPRKLTLDVPKEIEGFVVDTEDVPVPDVRIHARLVRGPVLESTTTDGTGKFVLREISASLPFIEITAKHRGHANAEGTWHRKSQGDLVLVLTKSKPLSIRVRGPEGLPVAKLRVTITQMKDYVGSTDREGICRFEGLEFGSYYWVHVDHPHLTYRSRPYSPRTEPHEFVLQDPATLSGVAVDAGGVPMSGVEIRHRHGPRRWVRATTDSGGRFRIGDLPAGIVDLHWESHDAEGTVEVDVAGARETTGYKLVLR